MSNEPQVLKQLLPPLLKGARSAEACFTDRLNKLGRLMRASSTDMTKLTSFICRNFNGYPLESEYH
jgi:hypothetical protein